MFEVIGILAVLAVLVYLTLAVGGFAVFLIIGFDEPPTKWTVLSGVLLIAALVAGWWFGVFQWIDIDINAS